ncbi:plancitoxin-1-like [Asterias amurensis]|uniref:plancitoxin-1-like n=1 Tax=Asterias amurensis TaxID=7602 RepID=UPI003AB3F89C
MMHSLHGAVLCVLAAAAVVMQCDAAITCLDEGGNPVDWFIVYKLPIIRNSSSKQVQQGYGYMYMDVHQTALKLSTTGLNTANHAIAHTLQQIYSNHSSKNVGYLMYNDALPGMDITEGEYGHTKGDLAFDASSGFWLVHSTPRFPRNSSQSYNWPATANKNGQTFLCVKFGYDQFETIGQQLMYNYPQVYDSNIPPKLAKNVPSLVKVTQGKHVTTKPWNKQVSLTSSGGQSFDSFAKFSNYGQDIYSAWLAPSLKSKLSVQTWQNGAGTKMKSYCAGSYHVENILAMNLGSEAFRHSKDHSKWAVTALKGSKWICIGDLNRMESQKNRAGGALCFENAAARKNFLDGITDTEKCP